MVESCELSATPFLISVSGWQCGQATQSSTSGLRITRKTEISLTLMRLRNGKSRQHSEPCSAKHAIHCSVHPTALHDNSGGWHENIVLACQQPGHVPLEQKEEASRDRADSRKHRRRVLMACTRGQGCSASSLAAMSSSVLMPPSTSTCRTWAFKSLSLSLGVRTFKALSSQAGDAASVASAAPVQICQLPASLAEQMLEMLTRQQTPPGHWPLTA